MMRGLIRAILACPPWFTMGAIGFGTLVVGLVVANPHADTFAAGTAWRALAGLRLWGIRPDETVWGGVIAATGLLMLIGLRFLHAALAAPDGELRRITFVANRVVWGWGGALWAGIGASFYYSNPVGIGSFVIVLFVSAPSFWVSVQVRRAVAAAEGGGGGE
jgi:hypothetical protein